MTKIGISRYRTAQVDLNAVVAGARALSVDLLAIQEVDRTSPAAAASTSQRLLRSALAAGLLLPPNATGGPMSQTG